MSRATPHTDLVRQLYAEHRDHMASIQYGAKAGNRVARALMDSMPIMETKLQALADLGRFVAEKEGDDAASAH